MTISSEAGSQIYMKMTYYAFLQCLGLFYFSHLFSDDIEHVVNTF